MKITDVDDSIDKQCNCAGILLVKVPFDRPFTKDQLKVLLVQGHWRSYPFSFPKGKKKKGEEPIKAAKRELYEETGITEKDYILFPRRKYIEYRTDTVPHKPHIVYYFAMLKSDVPINPIDTKEVMAADWYSPKDIYQMKRTIYLQRQQIVTRMVKDLLYGAKRIPTYERQNLAEPNAAL